MNLLLSDRIQQKAGCYDVMNLRYGILNAVSVNRQRFATAGAVDQTDAAARCDQAVVHGDLRGGLFQDAIDEMLQFGSVSFVRMSHFGINSLPAAN